MTQYEDALAWLYGRTRSGAARGPERARALLARLGNPQAAFPAVHVVGTNGKGSVCAMLAAGLGALGLRVGRFTSPALLDFRERIAVAGDEISGERVLHFVREARDHGYEGAFFDLTVALAFQEFARQKVDIAVVEAGVGGVSDATMNLADVRAVVITNVDLDHVDTIGPTLADIAREKAGAIRLGVPVVCGAEGEALQVVRAVAAERGAPLHAIADGGSHFDLPHPPALRGAYQVSNARLAAATLRLIGAGEGVEAALRAHWPGRLESFSLHGISVLVDGAHNPAGASALARELSAPYALVFGAMARKDAAGVVAPLLAGAAALHFASPGEGGVPPEELAQRYGGSAHQEVGAALAAALADPPAGGAVVAGSLYLAGKARAWLLAQGAANSSVTE